jgi:flagellar hook assembly protein FlgD
LEIYNLQGQKVKTIVHAKQAAGSYRTVWDGFTDEGQKTSSRLYLYRLHAGDYVQTKKMLFLK